MDQDAVNATLVLCDMPPRDSFDGCLEPTSVSTSTRTYQEGLERVDCTEHVLLLQSLARVCRAQGGRAAITDGALSLSYRELEAHTNKLAHFFLRAQCGIVEKSAIPVGVLVVGLRG